LAVLAAAPAERAYLLQRLLASTAGEELRGEIGAWVMRIVPVETLVPPDTGRWRPLIADALQFLFSRLSPARLAAKIATQFELPPPTPPEKRLLALIAKMPGLQKIGQVLAAIHASPPRCAKLSPSWKTASRT
jgi:hypothetical protein